MAYIMSLAHNLRSAMRKIQYSHLPDPRKYLSMHHGLPKCYRKSTLSEIAAEPGNSIVDVLSKKQIH